jgi:hypothetical protein
MIVVITIYLKEKKLFKHDLDIRNIIFNKY